ncbi:MAG TPA: hypothetical protein VFF73_34625, partial [Planctomycetota bacterium]|nr:hypothetical protein [Planctomycetota bacterium]
VADDRLREAERTFQETASIADEARLLTERVRAGQLAPERLALLAELRYEPAVLATGAPRGPRPHSVRRTFEALERFGPEVVVRAALVVGRRESALAAADEACLDAVEAWLASPTDERRARVERARQGARYNARLVADALLDRERFAKRQPASRTYFMPTEEFDAPLVAAVRDELTRWALAPHEPRPRSTPTEGTMLDLGVGWSYTDATSRFLVSAERLHAGPGDDASLQFATAPLLDFEIVRARGGFEVRDLKRTVSLCVNATPVAESALVTGDVLSVQAHWVEVRVLAAPFDDEVEAASVEAARLLERFGAEPERLEAAAAAGHLAATLAASRAGITLRPVFNTAELALALRRLPRRPTVALALAIGREVRSRREAGRGGEDALDRVLAALDAWLGAPPGAPRAALEAGLADLRAAFARTPPRDALERRVGETCLAALSVDRDEEATFRVLTDSMDAALAARIPDEQVRALVLEVVRGRVFED